MYKVNSQTINPPELPSWVEDLLDENNKKINDLKIQWDALIDAGNFDPVLIHGVQKQIRELEEENKELFLNY